MSSTDITITDTTSATHSLTLTESIKVAIAHSDTKAMYKLKDICDRIHSTGSPYNSYTPEDLPSDTLYEELVNRINSSASELKIVTQRGLENNTAYIRKDGTGISTTDVSRRHEKHISDLWMGSITKLPNIETINNALLLPKFDGCSCGVRLTRSPDNGNKFKVIEAVTRGTEEGFTTKKSNITEKFVQISDQLITQLSSSTASSYEFENGKTFSDVVSLTLRGEIVLKNRSTTTSAPASFVAGKINGYMEVWEESIEHIEFIPFEFIRLYFSEEDKHDIYVPTQLETICLLEEVSLFTHPYELVDLTAESITDVENFFDKLNKDITEPIDGVVYCSQEWRYPLKNEDTKPKAYKKFAWKPNSEATSTLRSIDYSLARDGKFTFILGYEPVLIKGKKYKQAKTATSRMVLLNGIGIGSVVTIKLAGDISPMIVDFVSDPEIEPYELPKNCPFCDHPTKLRGGKTPTLSCTNPKCREVTKQKMINFLKLVGIKGIAEGKLNALPKINIQNVYQKYLKNVMDFPEFVKNIDARTLMIALGIGGRTKVSNMIPSFINPTLPIMYNFDKVFDLIEPFYNNDPFIMDVVDYIAECL